jgi:hypothetical protein
MEIIKKEFVGEGGTHCVYQCEVIGKDYLIPLVLKIFKKPNSNKANEELQSYQAIKSLNIPTLTLLEKVEFEERPAFIGQYLNAGDWLFVSTNHVITDINRELDKIDPGHLRKLFKVVAEQELYDKKLEGIQNLPEVITAALADLKTVSQAKYQINGDSYFLGVIKTQKNSPLRYIVGDFGDINYCPEWNIAELEDQGRPLGSAPVVRGIPVLSGADGDVLRRRRVFRLPERRRRNVAAVGRRQDAHAVQELRQQQDARGLVADLEHAPVLRHRQLQGLHRREPGHARRDVYLLRRGAHHALALTGGAGRRPPRPAFSMTREKIQVKPGQKICKYRFL